MSKLHGGYFPEDMYVTPGVMDAVKHGGSVEVEDYAETIRMYFWDGVAFRRRIQELNYAKSDTAIILHAKYEFAKSFFKGVEFTKEGETLDPKIGDVFVISDSDPNKSLIPLRSEPKQDAFYGYGLLDGHQVKILEGPVETLLFGEQVEMWKVAYGILQTNGDFTQDENETSGWIAGNWFGEQIWADGAEVFKSK